MKKWLIGLLAAVLLLGGCSPRQAPSQPGQNRLITVGFSQAGAESDWRVAYTESMRSSLNEDAGYELLFSNARQQQDNQLKAIRTFIQQKVDYIVLAPVTETGWDSVLKEAKQAGIPVIIVDRQVEVSDPSLYCSWVGSDFRGTADRAVEWLEQELVQQGRAESTVRILHLQGTIGSTAQLKRTAALESGVAQHKNWELAAQLQGDFTQAKAYEVTLAYLKQNSDVDVIYCENDNMCFGVMQALDKMGMTYGTEGDVTLISFDAVKRALEACRLGKINLCVECNPLHGPRVRAILDKLQAGKTPDKQEYVTESLYTPDTLTEAFISSRKY